MTFKLGDVVRVTTNDHTPVHKGCVLTIIADNQESDCWFDLDSETVELDCVLNWPSDFELYTPRIESEVSARVEPDTTTGHTGSLYRPALEERKEGKVRVELVDNGFPLALRELAKVMTWAQEAKGYKDHDWQNLPDAEVQLAAATRRHCTDHIEMRVVRGKAISECVDHESRILHKAHELFGVAAQLELMLRGVIK